MGVNRSRFGYIIVDRSAGVVLLELFVWILPVTNSYFGQLRVVLSIILTQTPTSSERC